MNGIINIITKHSRDTTGVFAEGGGGDERGFASARVGGYTENGTWRAYGKWFDRNAAFSDIAANDDWRMGRAGFRSDWSPSCCDSFTLQGDYYDGNVGETQFVPTPFPPSFLSAGSNRQRVEGGNLLMRWKRETGEESDWSLQLYYDRTERWVEGTGFGEDQDTIDVDFQRQARWRQGHSVIWGFKYRNSKDDIQNSPFYLQFTPTQRADDTFGTFLQDEMTLLHDQLFFTLGSKFSWNDYTGFEYQPTARILYTPSNRKSAWASVSRAVRVPASSDDDVRLIQAPTAVPIFPTFPTVRGDRSIESEQLVAWEAGFRSAPTDRFYWDVAAFFNQYEDLHTLRPGFPRFDPDTGVFEFPLRFFNGMDAESYGFELASTWKVNPCWQLRGAYSFLAIDIHPSPQAIETASDAEGDSPRNQFFLTSSWDLGCHWEIDLIGRYTDTLMAARIPSYFEMDSRLAWRPTDSFEFAFIGRNLLDNAHPEFVGDPIGILSTEVEREIYGVAIGRY